MQDPHELRTKNKGDLLEKTIGRQLRSYRKANGLTVSELSKASGISTAMISKIENGQTSPSLNTIYSLSKALNIPVTALFRQFEENRTASFVPAGQGIQIERRGSRAGHQYQLLGHGLHSDVTVEPYMITLNEESDVFPSFQHKGQEFIHMLEGEMIYTHAGQLYRLCSGDSLFFDASAIHGPEKLVTLPIRFLCVISYPSDT